MQVLIHNQKGGAGKTTLAAHLAVALRRHGTVAACDLNDEQASLTAWLDARREAGIEDITQVRDPAAAGFDFVVIDTPPAAHARTAALIRDAGMILIPIRPGAFDSHAVQRTIEMLRAAKAVDKALFVLNAVTSDAKARHVRAMLENEGVHIWAGEVRHYERFDDAIPQGKGVNEAYPGSPAARAISTLLDHVTASIL